MKSLHLLISSFIIISFVFCPNVLAQNQSADKLYKKAKLAYQKPDCHDTLEYLDEYLKIGSPSEQKLASIKAVEQWCKKYLVEGIKESSAFGFMEIHKDPEITEQGKQMIKEMPKLQ